MDARLPLSMRVFERGWPSSNNVLFTGPGETALNDSGYVAHAPQTLALVSRALDGRRLDRLLNTHLHSDHCGGNAALQAAHGCATAIPAWCAMRETRSRSCSSSCCWNAGALHWRAYPR